MWHCSARSFRMHLGGFSISSKHFVLSVKVMWENSISSWRYWKHRYKQFFNIQISFINEIRKIEFAYFLVHFLNVKYHIVEQSNHFYVWKYFLCRRNITSPVQLCFWSMFCYGCRNVMTYMVSKVVWNLLSFVMNIWRLIKSFSFQLSRSNWPC